MTTGIQVNLKKMLFIAVDFTKRHVNCLGLRGVSHASDDDQIL